MTIGFRYAAFRDGVVYGVGDTIYQAREDAAQYYRPTGDDRPWRVRVADLDVGQVTNERADAIEMGVSSAEGIEHYPTEVEQARQAIERCQREEGPAEVAEAERWLRQAEHEERLPGASVRINENRFAGTRGVVNGPDRGHVFEVLLEDGRRVFVESKWLQVVSD